MTGNNVAGYSPSTAIVQAGTALQITPLVSADEKSAVVDVESIASDWLSPAEYSNFTPVGMANQAAGTAASLDRMNMLVQQLRTTVRVPVGRPVLVGGMTADPGTQAEQLYLIIEVNAGQ